jgi:hypothetical protein
MKPDRQWKKFRLRIDSWTLHQGQLHRIQQVLQCTQPVPMSPSSILQRTASLKSRPVPSQMNRQERQYNSFVRSKTGRSRQHTASRLSLQLSIRTNPPVRRCTKPDLTLL